MAGAVAKAEKAAGSNGKTKTTKKPVAAQGTQIVIRALPMKKLEVPIIGTSELVVSAWSMKAMGQMLEKQVDTKKGPKKQREARDPFSEYQNSLYWLDDSGRSFGFPAAGVKNAMVSAAGRFAHGVKMTELRGLVFVHGEPDPMGGPELIRVHGVPRMRMDTVRLAGAGRPADLRFRAGFVDWAAVLNVTYNSDLIDAESVYNLISLAGQTIGVCEWRPERNGSFGCFQVADDGDAKKIAKLQKDAAKAKPVQDTEKTELKRLKIDEIVLKAINPPEKKAKAKK